MENNQTAPPPMPQMAPPPAWLTGFKLPGFKGETASKGDGVIADPATQLDPSAKAGPLVTPLPDARTIGDWITAIIPDHVKGLVDYVITSVGGSESRKATNTSVSQADLDTLAANGVKFTPQNVLATGTTPDGKVVFLETGSSSAGLTYHRRTWCRLCEQGHCSVRHPFCCHGGCYTRHAGRN